MTAETCAHGQMTFRQGHSASQGKDWAGYFCHSCRPRYLPLLHPLVAEQEAIAWADERLRDPEVAGWTEAWVDPSAGFDGRFLTARTTHGLFIAAEQHPGRWERKTGVRSYDHPYRRAANANTEPENDVSTEQQAETLEQFKARVYTVGKAAAVEHGWCSVFDQLMDELGIEAPFEPPAKGTIFKFNDLDSILIMNTDETFRFVRASDGSVFESGGGGSAYPLDAGMAEAHHGIEILVPAP